MKSIPRTLCFAMLFALGVSTAFAQDPPVSIDNASHVDGPPIDPTLSVINDLEHLERLYFMIGRPADMVAVYHNVLRETQDPMLRRFVFDALARAQWNPTNPELAITSMNASLSQHMAMLARHPAPDRRLPPAP